MKVKNLYLSMRRLRAPRFWKKKKKDNSENLKQLKYNVLSCLLNYDGIKIKDTFSFAKGIMYFEKDIMYFKIIFTPLDNSL